MRARNATLACIFAGLIAATSGCANTTFRRAEDPNVNGIRYYRPATYILVKPDYDKAQADISFWSGPDTSVPFAVDPSAFAATNTTELKFARGLLTDVSTDVDTTKIAADTVAALSEVAKSTLEAAAKASALAAAALVSPPKTTVNEPPIFLFVATNDGFKQIYGPPLLNSPADGTSSHQ